MKEVPYGPYYCEDCDPLGTSAFLQYYFSAIDELRAEFDSSKEFVHFLHCIHAYGPIAKKLLKRFSVHPVNKKLQAERDLWFDRMVSRVSNILPTGPLLHSADFDNIENLPVSELARATELHNAALLAPSFMTQVENGKDGNGYLHRQLQTGEHKDEKGSNDGKITGTSQDETGAPFQEVTSKYLVGKIVRLYCPIDNQYHLGRIIDWRSARIVDASVCNKSSRYNALFEGDNDIARSEFLVRFPAGINGRKETITQWVILEEHSIAVNVSVVMAQRDRGRGVNGWKPAQLVMRSIIELFPVRNYITDEGHFALAIFFGDDNHLYADVKTETVDIFSPAFQTYKMNKMNSSPNVRKSYVQGVAAFMDMLMALAHAEVEEQRRTYQWHKLMLFDYAHPKCLTMKSEYGLPPLELNNYKREAIGEDESTSISLEEEQNSEENVKKTRNTVAIRPILCPLVQQGLDRQYLCDQMPHEGFNLDTVASIKCTTSNFSKAKNIAFDREKRSLEGLPGVPRKAEIIDEKTKDEELP